MNMQTNRSQLSKIILLTFLLVCACNLPGLEWVGGVSEPRPGPAVTIHEPAPGAQATVGDALMFSASANDAAGVIRIDLWVDDTLVLSQSSPDAAGLNPLSLSYPLAAAKTGAYALVARAFNRQGEMGESVVHYVTVVEAAASAPAQEYAQYIVQQGDTLENIAARLGVSVDDILKTNPGISNGQVVPRQVILIPMPKPPAQAAAPGPNGVQPVSVGPGGVQPGGGQPAGGQAGSAPNPPPPASQPSLAIKGIGVVTSPVYYGQGCANQPQATDVVATIEPPGAVKDAAVKYQYAGQAGLSPILSIPLTYAGGSNFGAVINAGGEAAQYLGQNDGAATVWVEVTDTSGKTSVSNSVTLLVNFCPGGGGLPPNLPGILPQFLPGALPSIQPGQGAQLPPNLFPNQNGAAFNPPNAALNAPGAFKASDAGDCRIAMAWDDVANETGYEVYRFDPGKPNSYRIAELPANRTQHVNNVLHAGRYGYEVEALKTEGGKTRVAASSIVWVEARPSAKCSPAPGPKRLFFQPLTFRPYDNSIQKAFVWLTLDGLSPLRVPRAGQDYYPVGDWSGAGEWAIPLPDTLLMKPGDTLSVEVRGSGFTSIGPVDLRGFRRSHTYESLADPAARALNYSGSDANAQFDLLYRLWLEDWQWGGKVADPSLPAPTNLKLDVSSALAHKLAWDYDKTAKARIDGFIVYGNYVCPGGDQPAHYVVTKGGADQTLNIETYKQPAGCTCSYQVSAFGASGESKLSAPSSGACQTGAPEVTVRVTFQSLEVHNLRPTPVQISLFVGNFVRQSDALVVFDGQTLSLQDINFDGRTHNNAIDVALPLDKNGQITVSPQFIVSNFGLSGDSLTLNLQDVISPGMYFDLRSSCPNNQCDFLLRGIIETVKAPSPPASQPGGQAGNPPPQNPPGGQAGNPPPANQPGNPPAANGTVRFVNHTSHPIISLNIDNQGDLIQTEAQVIPQNGWLDVNGVTAGNHVYAAENGFVSGGAAQLLLPLPVGTFSGSAGSVTINDPAITQLLTAYGQYSAFTGEYWDANSTIHPAAFCFYDDGSYLFYNDNKLTDSGRYSLVSRQAGVYGVTFQAGGIHGVYYYAGPMIGTMVMRNGPPSWPQIEYHRDGNMLCP
ncbi:MAG: hypothetical protein Fur0043_06290 [Anaerolineales bacterium]